MFSAAINEKKFEIELDSDLAKAAATLQSLMCEELCASYGDQLFNLMEYKDKASPESKPDSMDEEEWNKIKSTYSGAVKGKKDLDEIVYHAFINISEHIKFQMNQLS